MGLRPCFKSSHVDDYAPGKTLKSDSSLQSSTGMVDDFHLIWRAGTHDHRSRRDTTGFRLHSTTEDSFVIAAVKRILKNKNLSGC